MTPTTADKPTIDLKPASCGARRAARQSRSLIGRGCRADRGVLGRYTDRRGRPREVLARPGRAGSTLVIDRDARTLGDRRLVAHLGADEPVANAELVCRLYLGDPRGRRCRALTAEDLRALAPGAASAAPDGDAQTARVRAARDPRLVDRDGCEYRLRPVRGRLVVPDLRWQRSPGSRETHATRADAPRSETVSVRDVVAALESYEPARSHTAEAILRHDGDPAVSVAVLRAELRRVNASRIVLNRGLREAVLSAVCEDGVSMSEIALRCGRVKRDARGNPSGETSWLARRVGIAPEGGACLPTPWVHSDVLALIARAGLARSPRELELG